MIHMHLNLLQATLSYQMLFLKSVTSLTKDFYTHVFKILKIQQL